MIRFSSIRKDLIAVAVIGAGFLQSCVLKHTEVSGNDGKSVVTENGICHHVNPGSLLHPVVFCDKNDQLQLSVLKKQYNISKKQLESEIAHQLQSLIRATDIEAKHLGSAEIDVWVAAPVLVPESAYFIVVVKGTAMGFAALLPLDMRHWDLLTSPTLQLGASGYPSLQTWKSGRFVMAADRSIRNDEWQRIAGTLIESAGVTPSGMNRIKNAVYSGEGILVETEQFSEPFVAAFLQKSSIGKKYGFHPVWIPALEPDSYKAKGYSFTLKN